MCCQVDKRRNVEQCRAKTSTQCCGACCSGNWARVTTYVRVMQLRRYILTFDMMCNLLHSGVVLLFIQSENVQCPLCADLSDTLGSQKSFSVSTVHHAFGLTKPRRASKYVSVSVRVFRSVDLEISFFLHHLLGEELELFPPCQPLQSCHCQSEFGGCVEVLLPCRRTCSRCQPFGFCKSGCWHGACSTCCRLLQIVRI